MRIHHATAAKAKKFHITLTVEDNEVVATDANGTRLAAGLQGNKVLEDAITKATGHPAKKSVAKAATPRVAKPAKEVDPYEALAKAEGWKKTRWGFNNGEETVEADGWQDLCEQQGLELEEPEGDDEDSDAEQSKSIVKGKYKAKYKPTKNRCGDELGEKVTTHVSREDDAGDMRISLDALRTFAKANDCWVPSYASLKSRTGTWNSGMARMNVMNRLRAKIRQAAKAKEPFEIDWA